MSALPATSSFTLTRFEQLRYAREVIALEGRALTELAGRLDTSIIEAANTIASGCGCVVVTGVGKAGLIGQKLVGTFGSTGNRAHFLHPVEAIHGDLGRVGPEDIVLALSYSGKSEEVVRLLPALRRQARWLIGITSSRASPLGKECDEVLELGRLDEACSLGLAPTTSTTAMLAIGDALAMLASRLRGFTAGDFARFHPGGSLGIRLAQVDQWMRHRDKCRIASEIATVREILVNGTSSPDSPKRPSRRTGAVLLVDAQDRLSGIFTDSDLVRLLESRRDDLLDQSVAQVMTRSPRSVVSGTMLRDAISILADHRISELPVVDDQRRPIGLVDVTDVVSLLEPPSNQSFDSTPNVSCQTTSNWPNRSA
jgi:arabinose-5-phosphate isomerase